MMSLAQHLSDIVGAAFDGAGLARDLGRVTVSDRPDLAQFQCNGALSAAKAAKKNPREVAQAITTALQANAIFSKIDIAGPGFINLTLTDAALADFLRKHYADAATDGQGQTAVIDYGGANVAKAMHVGHLRAAIIGDAVRRIMHHAGYKTLGDVHMGDWGTNMGMLVDNYLSTGEDNLITGTDMNDAVAIQRAIDDMAQRYPRAAQEAKADAAVMERALAATVKIQNKEAPHYPLWQKIRDISITDLKKTYGALGVSFDLWKGEADVHDLIAPMVDDLKKKGFAVESDGAWVVPVAAEDDKKEYPPLILYKRDGAVMYGTTDMATLVDRMQLYKPDKIIYVVDQRQALHFEQVFRAVHKGGIVPESVELTHAGFGTMNGTDGKPFKTREGGVMKLEDLIGMAREKAVQRMREAGLAKEMPKDEFNDVAHKVAIAAIKFADLQNARQADYVFDLDRLTAFEGKTGPYLLYQTVRIKSLLAKAGYQNKNDALVLQDADRDLVLTLTQMPDALELALKHYAPHHLCDYAFKLAQAFSSFYGNCHILSEENAAIKNSRLALCAMSHHHLEQSLSLLGISVPNRM